MKITFHGLWSVGLIKVLQRVSETDMLTTSGEKNTGWFYTISVQAICENVATGAMQFLFKKSKGDFE